MKKHFLLIVITAAFVVLAQVSNAQETGKEMKKAEKERQKLAEKQEKERLKKPVQIEINSSIEDVGKLLIKVFKTRNYKVDQTGKWKIGMSLIPQQINTQSTTGGLAERKLIISLDEKHGKIKVTINIGMLAPDAFGRIHYVNLISDKKSRAEIEEILSAVKERLEVGNQ